MNDGELIEVMKEFEKVICTTISCEMMIIDFRRSYSMAEKRKLTIS